MLSDNEIICQCGIHSMEIYLLHGALLIIVRTLALKSGIPAFVIPFVLFVVGTVGSYVLGVNLIGRFKVAKRILFGGST